MCHLLNTANLTSTFLWPLTSFSLRHGTWGSDHRLRELVFEMCTRVGGRQVWNEAYRARLAPWCPISRHCYVATTSKQQWPLLHHRRHQFLHITITIITSLLAMFPPIDLLTIDLCTFDICTPILFIEM